MRLTNRQNLAAFTTPDLEDRCSPTCVLAEPDPEDHDALFGGAAGGGGKMPQLEGSQSGDVLEISGVGPDGKRHVIQRIQLGRRVGNRQQRRKAIAQARRGIG